MKIVHLISVYCVIGCTLLACTAIEPTNYASNYSPLSPLPTPVHLASSDIPVYMPQSSKIISQGQEQNQPEQSSYSMSQSMLGTPFETSIFALHENIFPLAKNANAWQPATIVAIESANRPDHGTINSRWAFGWDDTTYEIGPDGEKIRPQIIPSGDWVRFDMFHRETSIGVQFACAETCGWGQIRVDDEVRWIGNTYKMTDYVEIYLLPAQSHVVIIESLGHSGGNGSKGEVRFMAFGVGVLHRIFLPIIIKPS